MSAHSQTEPEAPSGRIFASVCRGRIRGGCRVVWDGDGNLIARLSPKALRRLQRRLFHRGLVAKAANASTCIMAGIKSALGSAEAKEDAEA